MTSAPAADDGTAAADDGIAAGDNGIAAGDDAPAGDDEAALPPSEDGYWDDVTAETLAFLRSVRSRQRGERLRQAAYLGYVVGLGLLIYVAPYVVAALQAPARAADEVTDGMAVVPLAAVAIVLTVLTALVRDALWRGPVLLDQAAAAWLLPTAVRRAALLRPRLRRALFTAGLFGAAAGAVAGLLTRLLAGGSAAGLAAAGAGTGGATLLLGVGLAGLVEEACGRVAAGIRGVGAWLWLAPALPAGAAAICGLGLAADPAGHGALGRARAVVTEAALWSGPWGWAVQPLAAALPPVRTALPAAGAAWPLGLAGAIVAAALAAVAADRRVDLVGNRALRSRAAAATAVAQSLGTLQPRRARLIVEAAQGRAPRARWRLPAPRHRALLVPWRDATALLRAPSRLLWGLLWLLAAAATAGWVADASAAGRHPAGWRSPSSGSGRPTSRRPSSSRRHDWTPTTRGRCVGCRSRRGGWRWRTS